MAKIFKTMKKKLTVVFDFDGVINSYKSGWVSATEIPDEPVSGIVYALKEISETYDIVIVSTRCVYAGGEEAIWSYLHDIGVADYVKEIRQDKPPAVAYIDDRAICFDGHPELLKEKIDCFKPWYKK